ncbi:MAG: cytochrome c oxidase subunit 3 [Hymenobacter sp.]
MGVGPLHPRHPRRHRDGRRHGVLTAPTWRMNQYGPVLFADLFFFITGFHGTHVFLGRMLAHHGASLPPPTAHLSKRGHYEMIEKIGLYWHFVDLVWVFVFTFFYLV